MWIERQPAGAYDFRWRCCASSNDGLSLIAAIYGGRVYTSEDGGETWVERQPKGDADGDWYCCASSSDGSKLIISDLNRRLYTSANHGETWVERRPIGDINAGWRGCASNADGSKLIVTRNYFRAYISLNGGETWTETQPAGDVDKKWEGCASNADGSKLIAWTSDNDASLYISSDGGQNWDQKYPHGAGNGNFSCCASSADGSKLIAAEWGYDDIHGRLYISSDGGETWVETQPAGDVNSNWAACACSADGNRLIAGANPGRLFFSKDAGQTWGERELAGAVDWYRSDCASSDDGMKIIVSSGGKNTDAERRLYTSSDCGECHSRTESYRPIIGGVSGIARGEGAGRLGIRVRDITDRKLVVLTNNHCAGTLYDPDYKSPDQGSLVTKGIQMMQPSPEDGGTDDDIFGQVKRAVPVQFGTDSDQDNKVDAAIVTTETDDTDTPINFLDGVPFMFLKKKDIVINEGVYVIGRTCGFLTPSRAYIDSTNIGVTISYAGAGGDNCKAVFTNQIKVMGYSIVASIFRAGDSGSVVLVKRNDTYKIIGLLFAASGDGVAAIINPIEDVVEQMEIEAWDGGIVVPGNMNTNVIVNDKTYTRVGSTIRDITHTVA